MSDTLPALHSLNLTGNEDLEDSDALEAIGEMLANRGGNLELEGDDTDDEDEEEVETVGLVAEDAGVDELADLMAANLAIKVNRVVILFDGCLLSDIHRNNDIQLVPTRIRFV